MRGKLNKVIYNDLIMIIGQSYGPICEDERDAEKIKEDFRSNILPKMEAKLQDIAKSMKRVFAIADGSSTDDILNQEKMLENATDKELELILSTQKPVSKQIALMNSQIK